jgi:hypothetical protein
MHWGHEDDAGPAQRRHDALGSGRRWGIVMAAATAACTGCALWLCADEAPSARSHSLMRTDALWAGFGASGQGRAVSLMQQREACCQEGIIAQVCVNTHTHNMLAYCSNARHHSLKNERVW